MNNGQQRPTGALAPEMKSDVPVPIPTISGPTPSTPPEGFSLRIVSLDHYMARPLPGCDVCWTELEGVAVQKVPVVRIFGSTPGGQKACLHLHGVR